MEEVLFETDTSEEGKLKIINRGYGKYVYCKYGDRFNWISFPYAKGTLIEIKNGLVKACEELDDEML